MRARPRTIGLLGGMSWESSILYERIINTETRRRLGGTHSADLVIRSYDFAAIEAMQAASQWREMGELLAADAVQLVAAGAECVVLCTNTMHKVASAIEAAIPVPFLHLADTTADAVIQAEVDTVALLGTRFTMEQDFYRSRLERRGVTVLVPGDADRTVIHNIIYTELVRGVVRPESKLAFLDIIEGLVACGATGVIAGCTEIELLVGAGDVDAAYFPTTQLHALAAVDWSLA